MKVITHNDGRQYIDFRDYRFWIKNGRIMFGYNYQKSIEKVYLYIPEYKGKMRSTELSFFLNNSEKFKFLPM